MGKLNTFLSKITNKQGPVQPKQPQAQKTQPQARPKQNKQPKFKFNSVYFICTPDSVTPVFIDEQRWQVINLKTGAKTHLSKVTTLGESELSPSDARAEIKRILTTKNNFVLSSAEAIWANMEYLGLDPYKIKSPSFNESARKKKLELIQQHVDKTTLPIAPCIAQANNLHQSLAKKAVLEMEKDLGPSPLLDDLLGAKKITTIKEDDEKRASKPNPVKTTDKPIKHFARDNGEESAK